MGWFLFGKGVFCSPDKLTVALLCLMLASNVAVAIPSRRVMIKCFEGKQ